MLGAMVRVAPPQDCEARLIVDSSKVLEKRIMKKKR
jgi:hypothetical protein